MGDKATTGQLLPVRRPCEECGDMTTEGCEDCAASVCLSHQCGEAHYRRHAAPAPAASPAVGTREALTFEEFAAANRLRCERDFKRQLGTRDAHDSMAHGVAEEAGEVAGKVRTLLGFSERKKATVEDLADECADLVSYVDLLCQSFGAPLVEALVRKFNRVSERSGSDVRIGVANDGKLRCPVHGCVLVSDLEGSNDGKSWCWTCSQEGGPTTHKRNAARALAAPAPQRPSKAICADCGTTPAAECRLCGKVTCDSCAEDEDASCCPPAKQPAQVQPEARRYPAWFADGMAMAIEADRAAQPSAPTCDPVSGHAAIALAGYEMGMKAAQPSDTARPRWCAKCRKESHGDTCHKCGAALVPSDTVGARVVHWLHSEHQDAGGDCSSDVRFVTCLECLRTAAPTPGLVPVAEVVRWLEAQADRHLNDGASAATELTLMAIRLRKGATGVAALDSATKETT